MDDPAIARGSRRPPSISVRDSRSTALDAALSDFGVRVLKTPVQAPKANAHCERLVGTISREFGLCHADERAAPSLYFERIRWPLQSGPSAFLLGSWHSRAKPGGSSRQRRQASTPRRLPNQIEVGTGPLASRISLGKGGSLNDGRSFLRITASQTGCISKVAIIFPRPPDVVPKTGFRERQHGVLSWGPLCPLYSDVVK